MKKVIEVSGLTKRFGHFTAVDHITFDVKEGEIFGFLGANGAGKTTAMQMLCGISKPTAGSGTVAGFDIIMEQDRLKCHLRYRSQRFALYEDLRVWEIVRLAGGTYNRSGKVIGRKTGELQQSLDVREERSTLVKYLPLGWKQILAFSV